MGVAERVQQLLADRRSLAGLGPQFASELSYGRHRGPARPGTRPAAVMALMYPNQGVWCMPMILRPSSMSYHAGQVSLPGGGSEPGESAAECALRELEEELGVQPEQVAILGRLTSVFVFASNFLVTPIVATSNDRPVFRPNSSEVEELYEIPLTHVLKRERWGSLVVKRGQLEFRAPSIVFQGRHIWGATGLILGEIIESFGGIFQE